MVPTGSKSGGKGLRQGGFDMSTTGASVPERRGEGDRRARGLMDRSEGRQGGAWGADDALRALGHVEYRKSGEWKDRAVS